MKNIYRYECLRCRHVWASKQERPRVCPKCKTPYWDTSQKIENLNVQPINVFSGEFEKRHREKIQKNKWGRWRYNPTTHCLEIVKNVGGRTDSYDVDLDRCNTGAKLLDWIYQVKGKNFISPDDVADLVYAIDDILSVVQSKLCSMGKNIEFDVKKYLFENVDPLFKSKEGKEY
jgi:hypothetical protein